MTAVCSWLRLARTGALVMLATTAPAVVGAHPLAPALLSVEQAPDAIAHVEWRVPLAATAGLPLEPRLPASCSDLGGIDVTTDGATRSTRWRARCAPSMAGETIGVAGLELFASDVLVRVQFADGRLARAVLNARRPVFQLPVREDRITVVGGYFRLGVAHLVGGADHLAFLLGLLLIVLAVDAASPVRRLVATVTAFTLGHSLSLSLAMLGVVRIPSGPVEVGIAISILWLAVELAATPGGGGSPWFRRPWWMAAAFGCLHGLGFAGALTEVGLPGGEVPAALVAFNLGLEAGQLAVVLVAVLPLQWLARAHPLGWRRSVRAAGYVGGLLAAFWAVERGTALF